MYRETPNDMREVARLARNGFPVQGRQWPAPIEFYMEVAEEVEKEAKRMKALMVPINVLAAANRNNVGWSSARDIYALLTEHSLAAPELTAAALVERVMPLTTMTNSKRGFVHEVAQVVVKERESR